MKIALIGFGTIAQYVVEHLAQSDHTVEAVIVAKEKVEQAQAKFGKALSFVSSVSEVGRAAELFVDCAGHRGLSEHGPQVLRAGGDLLTVSIGAFADVKLAQELDAAAREGKGNILMVSGAIGALDALRAARAGQLRSVRYIGRKPPAGWKGSRAERVIDLSNKISEPQVHFRGSAREAALSYPKNANVAAAIALSGIGFDQTEVELVADPGTSQNVHEIKAEGDFGKFSFVIEGHPLPSNPRTSALAAMSVIARINQHADRLKF